MQRIAFFNNKGGVGKTTLVSNIAHYLSTSGERRVLLIDLDPQCNATQLILPPESSVGLYWPDGLTGDGASVAGADWETIYSVARPLEEGDNNPPFPKPIPAHLNRFAVDLIPGHPRMSMFEDRLGPWFRDVQGGSVEGIRRTLWLATLLEHYEDEYDAVLFDMGPSLGALNRSILAAADYFITPMGADIFSVVALRNIADWITEWAGDYELGVQACAKKTPDALSRWKIPTRLAITDGFAGYTVQQYSTVSIRGERRATVAYDQIINRIPEQIAAHLEQLAPSRLKEDSLRLGDIPNLRSLVPLAQSANAPLSELNSRDGLTGGQYSQQRNYSDLINRVGQRIVENCFDV